MSEDRAGYDIEKIPDTRPLPDEEAAQAIDGDKLSDVQRFAAAVGSMPPTLAHAVCRAVGCLESFSNLDEIARVSGVSVSTLYRHIRIASKISKHAGVPPVIGSPGNSGRAAGTRWGNAARVTNAGKNGEKRGKRSKNANISPELFATNEKNNVA